MNPLHIVFDGRVIQDHFPGIGRYACNLLGALPGELNAGEIVTALRNPGVANARCDWARLASGGIRIVDTRVPVFSARNLADPRPFRAARTSKPAEVFHYAYYVKPLFGPRPAVTTLYDAISFLYPGLVPSATARFVIRLAHRVAIATSDAVITISDSAARDLTRVFPRLSGRIHVTHLAADAEFTRQSAEERQRVRQKFGLPKMFALYVASNKPHKNLGALVDAWHRVVQLASGAVDPPVLIVAGPRDPRFGQMEERVAALGLAGHVRHIGEIPGPDLPALYSACALFVYPSLHEGFGLTPLEAMACGAPVACSNSSSLPEVTADAALQFDPAEPAQIAAACFRLWSDPALRGALAAASVQRAAHFSWQATARATLRVYRLAAGAG